jgi:2'-5' RNA ligase
MEVIRAFIAFEIDENIKNEIMKIENKIKENEIDVKLVERENLHITLKFLGNIEGKLLEKIFNMLDNIKEKKFEISIEDIGAFPNEKYMRVLWVGIKEGKENIIRIQKELDNKLLPLGFKKEKDFIPHITIGRIKSFRNKEKLIEIFEEYRGYFFGKCIIDRLVLKKSILTPHGPIYHNLKEVFFD